MKKLPLIAILGLLLAAPAHAQSMNMQRMGYAFGTSLVFTSISGDLTCTAAGVCTVTAAGGGTGAFQAGEISAGTAPLAMVLGDLSAARSPTTGRLWFGSNSVAYLDLGANGFTLAGGELKTFGNNIAVTPIVNASSPYTILSSDQYIRCDATGGAVVINLPAATGTGRILTVKKIDATANACTPTRAGGDTIDGATTDPITVQYVSHSYVDGASTAWDIY